MIDKNKMKKGYTHKLITVEEAITTIKQIQNNEQTRDNVSNPKKIHKTFHSIFTDIRYIKFNILESKSEYDARNSIT
ncbi:MAG: hypothetical protein ACKPKO_65960 [Candidatus Fonsibacter sp.]